MNSPIVLEHHRQIRSINVGEMHISVNGSLIRTVLGSCIAVCLFDARSGVAGMNHFLLPYGPADSPADCRYGEHAIPWLIQRCISKGASPERMVAKIFGGASMQSSIGDISQRVGEMNIVFAIEELTNRTIPISSQDVGGCFARDIRFDTLSGAVRVRRIPVGSTRAAA